MLKFDRHTPVRDDLYDERIKRNGFIHVNKKRMTYIQKYLASKADTARVLAHNLMNLDSQGKYIDMERNSVLHFLQNCKGIPADKLKAPGTKGLSLNYKDVIKPLLASDAWSNQFLEWYSDYTSYQTKAGRGKNLVRGLAPLEDVDYLGEELHELRYSVEVEENLRYYYNNEDLISIPREYKASFGTKKGHLLVWGDVAQSDFRIAYNLLLRDEFNSEIMDSTEDKYEGIARVLAKFYNEEFDVEQFKNERELYKVNVLETIYGTRRGTTKRDNAFISRFVKYLDTCPRYQAYIESVKDRYETGLYVPVTGFWGLTQPNSGINQQKTINKCLNTPIQTGTSQMMILVVNTILDKFYSLGYTEDDVNIYMVRHDEPIFQISEEALKDAWIFEECSRIIVENWIPIDLKFSFGHYYSKEDPELTKIAEKSMRDNKFNITHVEPDISAEPYYPIPRTLVLSASAETVGDVTIYSLYHKASHSVTYRRNKETADDNLAELYIKDILSNAESLKANGYSAVVVFTDTKKMDVHVDGLYITVRDAKHAGNTYARTLTHFMCARFVKVEKYLHEIDMDLLNMNKGMIESVGDLDVLQG